MELTREEALRLHRQMWGEMKEILGDNPSYEERNYFKDEWCNKHFPNERITASCFLCEYAEKHFKGANDYDDDYCVICPIKWSENEDDRNFYCCSGDVDYGKSPISEILALPEREEKT